jgi:thiamine biosynthesis lipoprotein
MLAALACDRTQAAVKQKRMFYRMDTVTELTVVTRKSQNLDFVWQAIDSLLLSWENRFSVEREGSEVYAVNHSTDTRCATSPELARMVHEALRLGDTLGGGFDLTILPLKRLWGLSDCPGDSVAPTVPSDSAIRATRARIDYRRVSVSLDPPAITRDTGVLLDVGGIAKGAAIREACALLDRLGLHDYLFSSGGDIRGSGRRQDGTPWIIAIRHPRRSDAFLATMRMDSGCIVTSGDYERYWFTPDSQRVHHIFSPATGRSCTGNQSLTIWAMDPVEADVMSTGLFCRSADSIVAFVEKRPRLECAVVDSAGAVLASRGWKDRITWQ